MSIAGEEPYLLTEADYKDALVEDSVEDSVEEDETLYCNAPPLEYRDDSDMYVILLNGAVFSYAASEDAAIELCNATANNEMNRLFMTDTAHHYQLQSEYGRVIILAVPKFSPTVYDSVCNTVEVRRVFEGVNVVDDMDDGLKKE